MKRAFGFFNSTIGKKIAMAVSGLMLVGFVVGHMVGNLKIYQGAAKYNAYAEGLRELGKPLLGHDQFLWIARIGLLAAVVIHIVSAVQLTHMARAARPVGYRKKHQLSFSYASKTMRWGGIILLGFIVYHILHLTTGTVHQDFSHESVYSNVVSAFSRGPVAAIYIITMLPLGFHLYHGVWSVTQTLGIDGARISLVRRAAAATLALVVTLGNISIPVAVLAGLIK
jgi:succinate dehydrogenase / fumarate reductase cytochrome b subunit